MRHVWSKVKIVPSSWLESELDEHVLDKDSP